MCHDAFTVLVHLDKCSLFKEILSGYLDYPTENRLTHTLFTNHLSNHLGNKLLSFKVLTNY